MVRAKKGKLGPVKAKVHASREKMRNLGFLNLNRVIYTNHIP
jgi:hypothetical protein